VHAIVVQQLVVAQEKLEAAWESIGATFMQANPKDFKRSSCEKIGSTQVHYEHFEPTITHHGSNMVFSSVFKSKLKTFETNKERYLATAKVSNVKIKRTKIGQIKWPR
jgi:hypothetical protein